MERNLLLLFDRPNEPVFQLKEDNVALNLPTSYFTEEYQPFAVNLTNRFGSEASTTISIKEIALPNLEPALTLNRRESFSLFIKSHRKCSNYLIELFMGMKTLDDLMSLGAYCRDRVNTQMYIYALSVAILHRSDTKNVPIPNLCEIVPDSFIDTSAFNRAREIANIVPVGSRKPIEIPVDWTATDTDPEHRVAYWREDIGINLHHWHWHLVYPFEGPRAVVNKDRRGEFVYYMHHQILARYDIERLCNGLPRTRRLMNLREPIPEGYFPKMDQAVSGRNWPGRPANMTLSDVNRPVDEANFTIPDLELYMNRIIDAIKTRMVQTTNGTVIHLDEKTGIDILGNMMEASILSPNPDFYGDLHNMTHVMISYIHDPDHRFLEFFGTMGNPSTAMRDPLFYRWHATVDWLFALFKDSLPPYTPQELNFPGVSVQDIHISSAGANPNTINCHWSKSDIELSRGLAFTPRESVLVRVQHLDHEAFSYNFSIYNSNSQEVSGTVRVFIAPKFDEIGNLLSLNDQRMLMIEMDKFTKTLRRGQNFFTNNSIKSAISIPFEATFRNLDKNRPSETDYKKSDSFNFCGCGWPQHMLVPKGTQNGFPMDLFVMVSDYRLDKVDDPEPAQMNCTNAVSFCGLKDKKYPDARAMGFPFDRVPRPGINTMNEFLTSNMKMQQITIRFSSEVKPRRSGNVDKL